MKVIYTMNDSKTAIRMRETDETNYSAVAEFAKGGKIYNTIDFVDKDPEEHRSISSNNPYFWVFTKDKIYSKQIHNNESIINFALSELKENGREVIIVGDCPAHERPIIEIRSTCFYCGDGASEHWLSTK